MYIIQYLHGRTIGLWHFPDDSGQLVDQQATEKRKDEWDSRLMKCRLEAMEKRPAEYEQSEFAFVVRSRLSPRDVPDIEYRKFTEEVTERTVGKLVGKNKPKLVNHKLK